MAHANPRSPRTKTKPADYGSVRQDDPTREPHAPHEHEPLQDKRNAPIDETESPVEEAGESDMKRTTPMRLRGLPALRYPRLRGSISTLH